jgi:hypothetical protein
VSRAPGNPEGSTPRTRPRVAPLLLTVVLAASAAAGVKDPGDVAGWFGGPSPDAHQFVVTCGERIVVGGNGGLFVDPEPGRWLRTADAYLLVYAEVAAATPRMIWIGEEGDDHLLDLVRVDAQHVIAVGATTSRSLPGEPRGGARRETRSIDGWISLVDVERGVVRATVRFDGGGRDVVSAATIVGSRVVFAGATESDSMTIGGTSIELENVDAGSAGIFVGAVDAMTLATDAMAFRLVGHTGRSLARARTSELIDAPRIASRADSSGHDSMSDVVVCWTGAGDRMPAMAERLGVACRTVGPCGAGDLYVAWLHADLSAGLGLTRIGGSGEEWLEHGAYVPSSSKLVTEEELRGRRGAIGRRDDGRVLIAVGTQSSDAPIGSDTLQPNYAGGILVGGDVYLAQFDARGEWISGSYFGGNDDDCVAALHASADGWYFAGWSRSEGFHDEVSPREFGRFDGLFGEFSASLDAASVNVVAGSGGGDTILTNLVSRRGGASSALVGVGAANTGSRRSGLRGLPEIELGSQDGFVATLAPN